MKLASFILLTKPTIILLVAITGLTTMAAEGSLFERPLEMLLVLLAILLSAGAANGFNQVIDRDIDSIMERTKAKRPLPLNQISVVAALIFTGFLAVISNLYLWVAANPVAAWISIATILYYVCIYTLWLKRRHYYNIVIGGAAGATAPLIASAAAYGEPSALAWVLFLIIFMWTPPHFWALALAVKEDYQAVKIPMLPNVRGEKRTKNEIWIYTWGLVPLVLLPPIVGGAGALYLGFALLLSLYYLLETWVRLRRSSKRAYRQLFGASILYLLLLFLALGIDGALRFWELIA